MSENIKLFDSELKIMEVLWEYGELPAREIADILGKETGWNINTTYTIIKKCVAKGAVERREPRFMCRALIPKEAVQQQETDELINRVFGGSMELLVASLLERKKLTPGELERLKKLAEEKSQK